MPKTKNICLNKTAQVDGGRNQDDDQRLSKR